MQANCIIIIKRDKEQYRATVRNKIRFSSMLNMLRFQPGGGSREGAGEGGGLSRPFLHVSCEPKIYFHFFRSLHLPLDTQFWTRGSPL